MAKPLAEPKATLAQLAAPLKILSLTGGGYRGLFTAQVLTSLCRQARHEGPLDASFSVFAGTSIGGIMACALAVGLKPQRVLDMIDAYGPSIFPNRKGATARRVVFGTLYDAGNLKKAIRDCLGSHGSRKFSDLQCGVLVPAVDWHRGRVQVFCSGYFGKSRASAETIENVCLATAAAPTYFAPHDIDGVPMLDGGLLANNPDMLAILEVLRRSPGELARMEILSIGTAGYRAPKAIDEAEKSGVGWSKELPIFMMDVQETMAAEQAGNLLGRRYLRVNHPGQAIDAFERMDAPSDAARTTLLRAAKDAAEAAYKSAGTFVDRMLTPATPAR